jgi:hypothetical protein
MSKQLPGCSGLLTPCLCKGHEANLSSCCIKTPPHPSRGRGTLTLHLLRRVVQKHLVHTVRCFASLHRIVPARHTAGRIRRARIPQNEPYASKYVTNICSGVRCLHPKEGLARGEARSKSPTTTGETGADALLHLKHHSWSRLWSAQSVSARKSGNIMWFGGAVPSAAGWVSPFSNRQSGAGDVSANRYVCRRASRPRLCGEGQREGEVTVTS